MNSKINDNSAAIAAGVLFNAIGKLPAAQAEAVYAQPQAERERIMALDDKARAAAIAELMNPKQPSPPRAAAPAATKEGTK